MRYHIDVDEILFYSGGPVKRSLQEGDEGRLVRFLLMHKLHDTRCMEMTVLLCGLKPFTELRLKQPTDNHNDI